MFTKEKEYRTKNRIGHNNNSLLLSSFHQSLVSLRLLIPVSNNVQRIEKNK